ncbi:retrovirus-related pol polyprotein from transposon TNT 1-94 [Tanacetum coccineum]
MLSSTGVKPSTSASGSQPSGNTKKDKILQTPSSTRKNKVEAHPRKVISSLKNKDCVVEPKETAHVQHSKLNVNSELKCVKCNGCMLFDNHDLCVLEFINNVNACTKPIGWTFTIVGNACPLTRITITTEVPLRKPTALNNETPKPVITLVYSRKPRKSKTNDSVSKSKIGNVTISRVYYVEGLGHNLFSVRQFCDSNLEVAFRQHTCFIRNLEGVDLLTGSRGNNLYTLSLGDMMVSSPICLLSKASKTKSWLWHRRLSHLNFGAINHLARHGPQNGVVERHNRTLIEAARTMSIYAKALLFLWAEAIATACYTQNCSIVRLHHGKTPYELLHDKLPDLSFSMYLVHFAIRQMIERTWVSYNRRLILVFSLAMHLQRKHSEFTTDVPDILSKTIHVDFDELTAMASKHSSSGLALHEITPATISSRLVPNPTPSTPFVPPSRTDLDILFQPLFDELLTPQPRIDLPTPEVIARIAEVVVPEPTASTGSPSSTTVDQDAPSPKNDSEASSSSDVIPTVVQTVAPNSEHVTNWTKDYPLDNIIGELERPVSTRLQLHEQVLFCYYDAFLSSVEPKTYKDALTQSCWIEVMQENLNEFKRLEVWELVPHLDKVMVITLKWIYKVKLDELGGILKNKARLVAHGYR